ncbi:MAG: glycosyltransferase family A protein, partial [Clostridia bacterium]|nr:glycosyltransferase family A protein [Clostridia bacterium]
MSVVIPCYNAENTVGRAIASVFRQGYHDTELIVVDDGSTDNSRHNILEWQERFKNANLVLRYVYQENQGSGGAVNTGLKLVTGSYLTLLDADDEYLPGAIAERAAYLRGHPECDVVRSNGWIVNGGHR